MADIVSNLDFYLSLNSHALDGSGNDRTVTLSAGAPTFATGQVGNALTAISSNGRYTIARPLITDTNWSIGVWFKYTAGALRLFETGSESGSQTGAWLQFDDNGGANIQWQGNDDEGPQIFDADANFSDGAWHHLVLTLGGTIANTEQRIYIDGVYVAGALNGTATYSVGHDPDEIGSQSGAVLEWDSFTIGALLPLDEICVYRRTLTDGALTIDSVGDTAGGDVAALFAASPVLNPIIRSNGGGTTAAINVAEGATTVTTGTADGNGTQTWTKSGPDSSLFSLNSSSGALTLTAAKDYETPVDADGDGVYVVNLKVANAANNDVQIISVTITNIYDAPGTPDDASADIIVPWGVNFFRW